MCSTFSGDGIINAKKLKSLVSNKRTNKTFTTTPYRVKICAIR